MSDQEWHFGLEGDEFDLESIAGLFQDEVTVANQHGKTELIVKLPFGKTEAHDALNAAQGLIAKLNAINQIVYNCHDTVRLGSIGYKNPETSLLEHFIIGTKTVRGRARIIVGGTLSGGAPQPPPRKLGDQFLAAANRSEHLDRALYLYGSLPHDWRGLFMVLEAAEDAQGGESGLIAKNYVPVGQIKNFKGTANSYKALKHEARHGSTATGFDQARQTIDQAQEMVKTILNKWCRESG